MHVGEEKAGLGLSKRMGVTVSEDTITGGQRAGGEVVNSVQTS